MTLSADAARAARRRRRTLAAGIVGLGGALPERVVPNAEITPAIGVEPDWIVRRTGIRERRYAEPRRAARRARRAGRRAPRSPTPALDGAEVDLVLVASCSQDSVMPNAAPQVAHALGARRRRRLRRRQRLHRLHLGARGGARRCSPAAPRARALVIGAEIMSRHVDPADRNTAALFGDGAGAIVCAAGGRGRRSGRCVLGADGGHAGLIVADRDTQLLAMDGHETFKQAVRRLGAGRRSRRATAAGVAARRRRPLRLPPGQHADPRVARRAPRARPGAASSTAIARLGNTSAASVPLALDAGAPRRAPRARACACCSAAAGSGFTWGAARRRVGARVSARPRAPARSSPAARAGSARRSRARSPPTAGRSRSTTAAARTAPRRPSRRSRPPAAAPSRSPATSPTRPSRGALLDGGARGARRPGALRSSTTPACAPTGSRCR